MANRVIEISILFLIIFTPLFKGTLSGWAVWAVHFVSFILLILWIMKIKDERNSKFKKTPLFYPIMIFFFLAILSVFFSFDRKKSILEFIKLCDYIIIFYIVVHTINSTKQIRQILYTMVGIGFFISILGLLQYVGGMGHAWWISNKELSATFENSNYYAAYMNLIIPMAIALLLYDDLELGKRIMLIYCLGIMIVAYIYSLCRGGWISLSIALVIMLIVMMAKYFIGHFEKVKPRLWVLILVLPIIIYFSKMIGASPFINSLNPANFYARLTIWKEASNIVKAYPLVGAGIGVFNNFNDAIPEKLKNRDNNGFIERLQKLALSSYQGYDGLNFDNEYFQVGTEMGIPALVIIAWIVLRLFYESGLLLFKKNNHLKQIVSLGFLGGGIASIILMLSANVLRFMSNTILLTILAGLIFVSDRQYKRQSYK
ncbi:MAG: O-antigen ligase family protein [bacterium]